jgi:hypothetical protein
MMSVALAQNQFAIFLIGTSSIERLFADVCVCSVFLFFFADFFSST